MTEKLKPCPFCGGKEQVMTIDLTKKVAFIQCQLCNARAGEYEYNIHKGSYSYETNAIAAWNRRVNDESKDD